MAVGADKAVGGSFAGGIGAAQLIGVRFAEQRVVRRERAVADSASIQSRTKFDPMNPRPEPPVMRMVFFINLETMKFHESPRMRAVRLRTARLRRDKVDRRLSPQR